MARCITGRIQCEQQLLSVAHVTILQHASDGNLEKECEKAFQQIIDVGYTESLEQEGIHKIIKYGIACYKKKCKVEMKIEGQKKMKHLYFQVDVSIRIAQSNSS